MTSSLGRALPRWAPALSWGSAVLAALVIAQVPQNRFDQDFASLEDSDLPAFRLDKIVNRLLGHSQTPMVVLTDDVAAEREALQALRDGPQAQPGQSSTVQLVVGVADLVVEHQPAKRAVIAELNEEAHRIRPAWLKPHQQAQLEEIKPMTSAEPFGRADLPVEMRRQFQGPRASADSGFVMIYPAVSLSDATAIGALTEELRAVRLPSGEPLVVAGGSMVLVDMLDLIEREGPRIIGLTVGLVFVVLMLLTRCKADELWSLAAAATTLALTAGLMPLTGVRLNYLNIVLVPVLFGITIDGVVHLTTRVRECSDVGLALSETGQFIAGSLLTTGLGFGAFLLANHPSRIAGHCPGRTGDSGRGATQPPPTGDCFGPIPSNTRETINGAKSVAEPSPPWRTQWSKTPFTVEAMNMPPTQGSMSRASPSAWACRTWVARIWVTLSYMANCSAAGKSTSSASG